METITPPPNPGKPTDIKQLQHLGVLSFLTATSAIMNAAALYIIWQKRPLKAMDTLLLNNFICTFLYGVFTLTERIMISGSSNYHLDFGDNMALQVSTWYFGKAQLFMLMLIATQRVIAVYYPLKMKSWVTKRRTIIAIILIYIFLAVYSFAVTMLAVKGHLNRLDSVRIYGLLISIVTAAMFSMYIAIFAKLMQLNREGRSKKMKSYVFSLVITFSNLVSYIPLSFHIFSVDSTIWLGYLVWFDPIFNPVFYILLKRGGRMRQAIQRIMKSCKDKKIKGKNDSIVINEHVEDNFVNDTKI